MTPFEQQGVLNVRTSFFIAALATVLTNVFVANQAQAQQTSTAGTSVAVIDVPFIFKNHIRFKAAIDDIKKDIDQYKEFVTAEQAKIRAEAEKLQQYKQGSAEFNALEEKVARMQVDLKLEGAKRQKVFMEREADVYFRSYREVEAAVANFAKRYGISLVLRFSGEEMDPDKRESIMQGINRLVVYQNRLNITQPVLDELNRQTPPPSVGGRTGPTIPGRN